jgi:hypothetical protein
VTQLKEVAMGKKIVLILAFALAAVGLTATSHATVIDLDIYEIGSNPPGSALDPTGAGIGGVAVIDWVFVVTELGTSATLSIVAEGVDGGPSAPGGGEDDEVFINGTSLGFLTKQDFASPLFNLQPGPGALAGITALTSSFFDVTPYLVLGVNTIEVHVDPGNWVNEIETSRLEITGVPEPGSALLMVAGLLGLQLLRRRV